MERRRKRLVIASSIAALWLCVVLVGLYVWLGGHRQPHRFEQTYITLDADADHAGVFQGEWDISITDLSYLFPLDANHDGQITFEEVKPHFPEMAHFAYSHLQFGNGRQPCTIQPDMVEEANRGGAEEYMVLLFKLVCPMPSRHKLSVRYDLFFGRDPTHSALLVVHDGGQTDTAVLTRKRDHIVLHTSAMEGGD